MAYLISYHANFEPVLQDFSLIANHKLLAQNFILEKDLYEELCSQLDMKKIDMTYVIHCPNSFGVAWTHVDGWKLVYSGDTMPCSGLVEIGEYSLCFYNFICSKHVGKIFKVGNWEYHKVHVDEVCI